MSAPTFAIAVAFETKPDNTDEFVARVTQQAKDSLDKEDGCHQFDVLVDEAKPSVIFLYETYTDAAAFDVHCKTEHFADFSQTVEPWVVSKDIRRLNLHYG